MNGLRRLSGGGPGAGHCGVEAEGASADAGVRAGAIDCLRHVQHANLHLALVQLPQFWFGFAEGYERDVEGHVTCLRSVLMKPEHEAWLGRDLGGAERGVCRRGEGVRMTERRESGAVKTKTFSFGPVNAL